jgi:hypothetical protein
MAFSVGRDKYCICYHIYQVCRPDYNATVMDENAAQDDKDNAEYLAIETHGETLSFFFVDNSDRS